MKNLFNSVRLKRPRSNYFEKNHEVKLSGHFGNLIPVLVEEVLPGDSWDIACESLVRLAPMITPPMQEMYVSVHTFFVPNRLVWPAWEEYINNNDGNPAPAHPYITVTTGVTTNWDLNGLMDYMGIPDPTDGAGSQNINAIPFAAYQMIYNEYYRDQNLVSEIPFELVDGDNNANIAQLISMRKRAWAHEYFTSALPFAQKGSAVDLPLGTVELDPDWTSLTGGAPPRWIGDDGSNVAGNLAQQTITGGPHSGFLGTTTNNDTTKATAYDPQGSLIVGATTINDLRTAFKMQEWLERNARGGTRYIEMILAHFGVRSDDARLQRPEYITGTKTPIKISEVLQTSESATSPQGNMAGHGLSYNSGKYGKYYAKEHGFLISIMSLMSKAAYMQGLPKWSLKINDTFDLYWPSFAHLGEQEILRKELVAYTAVGDEVFGYTPRYAEYRYSPDRVCGDFRTSLSFWHLARQFQGTPLLNQSFIEYTSEDAERIFAVQDGAAQFYAQIYHRLGARRLMPRFGTPTL